MPRSAQSAATKTIQYFQTAALPAVEIVLGLVKEIVASRTVTPPKAKRKARKAKVVAEVAATPKPKKSHKAKGPKAAAPAAGAEVEEFGAGEV